MSTKGKVEELDELKKSKKKLEKKAGRIEKSLEFSKDENVPKKKKAISRVREKMADISRKAFKLQTEL